MTRAQSLSAAVADAGDERSVTRWAGVVALQAVVLVGYLLVSDAGVIAPRYLLYPFVWIDVAGWAMLHVSPNPASTKHRLVAAAVSVAYLVGMLSVAGFVGHGHASMTGWRVVAAPPGWGPMVAYQGAWLRLYLVPFQVLGYVALAYLLYAALLDATRAALSGVFGLVSCVGCTWTLVSPLVVGAFGVSSTVGATIYSLSYDLTTVVFLATVGLLVWTIDRRRT